MITMGRLVLILTFMTVISHVCFGQAGGGSAVFRDGQSVTPQANERAKRAVTKDEMPPTATSMFLDASVLINVTADEYVAVFGISQEGATLEESSQKMDATIAQFSNDLRQLGVGASDLFVDFVAQNRIYGYEVAGDLAKEKLAGFEVKKNVSVHYKDKAFLDKCIAAASRSQIFDLIKVDYIERDIDTIRTKLMEIATRVIKRKAANHERLLGIKFRQPQVYTEKYSSYYPTDMYSAYTAYESEDMSTAYYRQKFTVQGARKNRTFYFDALTAESFDHVVNPVVVEPVIQFTLYLKVKYETGQSKPPAPARPKGGKPQKRRAG
ncbi:MAG: SIMPL domain-containing protein [Armatimonadetes bacterium]|nr:SIMPL domain-containing protein [Armatimonadota bacterium]